MTKEFNRENAIKQYTILMQLIHAGAYEERSAEQHLAGTWPEDGIEENVAAYEHEAALQGLTFCFEVTDGTYTLVPMSPDEIAAFKEAEELAEVCKAAGEQAAHDIPYCSVEDVRPYQYHYQSGRWYVEVDLTHHDPDEGKATALYRVWRVTIPHGNHALAAFKVDIWEAE